MDSKVFSSSIRLVEVLDLDSVLFFLNVWLLITLKNQNLSSLFILHLKSLPVLLNHTTLFLQPTQHSKTPTAPYYYLFFGFWLIRRSLWLTMKLFTIFAREIWMFLNRPTKTSIVSLLKVAHPN